MNKYWTKDEYGRWYLSGDKPRYTLDDLPNGYSRECGGCGAEMLYKFKDCFEFDSKNHIACHKCQQRKETPTRNCEGCNKVLLYINKYVYRNAIKRSGKCNSCAKRKVIF